MAEASRPGWSQVRMCCVFTRREEKQVKRYGRSQTINASVIFLQSVLQTRPINHVQRIEKLVTLRNSGSLPWQRKVSDTRRCDRLENQVGLESKTYTELPDGNAGTDRKPRMLHHSPPSFPLSTFPLSRVIDIMAIRFSDSAASISIFKDRLFQLGTFEYSLCAKQLSQKNAEPGRQFHGIISNNISISQIFIFISK